VVIDRLKFHLIGRAGRRHFGITFAMPMASDLSYFHLSFLFDLRMFGHADKDHG
jgi:hypothetical protein